jgi:hypothetical protein
MSKVESFITIDAPREVVFSLSQDYERRLLWDPFLREARLLDGAQAPAIGVRAWCVANSGWGMETEYVSFRPPELTAVKMTKGPGVIASFAGSWRFEPAGEGRTRVIFKYQVEGRPRWLRWLLNPIMSFVFGLDTRRRLAALKRAIEEGVLR